MSQKKYTMTDSNDDDNNVFNQYLKGVKPLKIDTVEHPKPQPKIYKKRLIQAESEFKSPIFKKQIQSPQHFFAHHLSKTIRSEMTSGLFITDATLDLHGLNQYQAERKVKQFITDCFHHHVQKAIIIHGQGHHSPDGSVLKPTILHLLTTLSCVQAYHPAHPRDGGKGATYVYLQF